MIDWFPKKFLSAPAYVLWCALDDPEAWVRGEHRLRHKPTGVELWIGNGRFFMDGYCDTPPFLGYIDRHIIWHKIQSVSARQVMVSLLRMKEPRNG